MLEDKIYFWANIYRVMRNFQSDSEGYYHKEIHSGNILNHIWPSGFIEPEISGFELSCPVNEEDLEDNRVYGVLPFVAP